MNMIEDYILKENWMIKENSNASFSLQGLHILLANQEIKRYWLDKVYDNDIKVAQKQGKFHIHDLGYLCAYCNGWDLYDLLVNGLRGDNEKMVSKPPKHFSSALAQILNFFFLLQGESAGAQAFSNFDTLLAPFVRGMNRRDIKQNLQEFIFGLNVPTRTGFQAPFTNITLDISVPEYLKDTGVIVGGEMSPTETYDDFKDEVLLIDDIFMEVLGEGDGIGNVFSFPIPTINITKDFCWDNLQSLWKATRKYGIPYFSNYLSSNEDPNDYRSMCCRLRLDSKRLSREKSGLFGSLPLTGSIGVVTINLPQLGYLYDESNFFEELDNLILLAKSSLDKKREVIEHLCDIGLFPYSKYYLRSIKSSQGEYFANHFRTIGVVGMNECLLNLLGDNLLDKECRKFGVKILKHISSLLSTFDGRYNLEATPSEGCSYSLAQKDKNSYPDIITAGDEVPFYTNSSQLPVDTSDDVFELLELQEELQCTYTGGTVFHILPGEKMTERQDYVVRDLIKRVCETTKIPYFTFTPTFSVCPVHNYIPGEEHICPSCGAETRVYSRIVGYYRPISAWNKGKAEEFKQRKYMKL